MMYLLPSVDIRTDTSENIIFPRTTYVIGNYEVITYCFADENNSRVPYLIFETAGTKQNDQMSFRRKSLVF